MRGLTPKTPLRYAPEQWDRGLKVMAYDPSWILEDFNPNTGAFSPF